MDNLVLKNIGPDLENSLGVSLQQFLQQKNKIGYDLHRMVDTHLKSQFPRDITPASDILYVYLFSAIGFALLLIACFNSMNLSTARFVGQLRAVSIRKMLGATRGSLIYSFFNQSIRISFLSASISILLAYLLLPYVNFISGKAFDLSSLLNWTTITCLFLIALATGLLSASYPSFYLTSFKPSESLRGKSGNGSHSELVRNVLVSFQYGISITMAVFTIVLFGQLDFIQHQDIGFQKERIISLRNIDRLGTNALPFKNALVAEEVVAAASFTDRTIFERMSGEAVRVPGESQSHIMNFYISDEDQLDVMGYQLTMGRFFSKDFQSDSTAVVINQAAMKELGWTTIEGKELAADGELRYKVVGVISDFNYETLRSEIKPLLMLYQAKPGNVLTIRFKGNPADIRQAVKKNWELYGNNEPMEYAFVDEDFERLFLSEVRIGRLLTLSCITILVIASLGLFALSSFVAEKRTKEIGIRKVMGATSSDIRQLLLSHFLKLILIAFLFSLPFSYYLSQRWLEGFAFRQPLTFVPFAVAGIGALLISLLTLSYYAIRASRTDPASALRLD
jgi:putative ABC transport system permease protein